MGADSDPARVTAWVWSNPAEAIEFAAQEIDPIRLGNIVVFHYGDAAIEKRVCEALDSL